MKTSKVGQEFNRELERAVFRVDTDFAVELLQHHPDHTDPVEVIGAVEACIAERPEEEAYLWYESLRAYIKETLRSENEYFRAAPLHLANSRISAGILKHRNRARAGKVKAPANSV